MKILRDKKQPIVLIGVCGGVAAYKAVEVVSGLRQQQVDVYVTMTRAAAEFVTPLTFAAVSGNNVLHEMFAGNKAADLEGMYPHLYPATHADAFVLCPATANMMGQIAHGLGRDIVSTNALSLPSSCQRYFCPSMNVEMWEQPMVQRNTLRMEEFGWNRIGPDQGHLACGMQGAGRLAAPDAIVARILSGINKKSILTGKRVLILSGPTREHIDPVRFIGNSSSGKMGKALAEAAVHFGGTVDFVSGPVASANLPRHERIAHHPVISADDMLAQAATCAPQADLIIFVAAVADYRPREYTREKSPKRHGVHQIDIVSTPDIAATLGHAKKAGQVSIGFALQTGDGHAEARDKLESKNLDAIVLNHPETLGADSGSYEFIARDSAAFVHWGTLAKQACAEHILEAGIKLARQKQQREMAQ